MELDDGIAIIQSQFCPPYPFLDEFPCATPPEDLTRSENLSATQNGCENSSSSSNSYLDLSQNTTDGMSLDHYKKKSFRSTRRGTTSLERKPLQRGNDITHGAKKPEKIRRHSSGNTRNGMFPPGIIIQPSTPPSPYSSRKFLYGKARAHHQLNTSLSTPLLSPTIKLSDMPRVEFELPSTAESPESYFDYGVVYHRHSLPDIIPTTIFENQETDALNPKSRAPRMKPPPLSKLALLKRKGSLDEEHSCESQPLKKRTSGVNDYHSSTSCSNYDWSLSQPQRSMEKPEWGWFQDV